MATNRSVIVLLPNGRRQNVKVTQNTTILQVIEEVCQKLGYKSQDYDVKHYKRVLDCNAILRFTGLPNNAQLELIPCTKPRQESNITLCIQLENGTRVTGEHTPVDSLHQVLEQLCPNEPLNTAVLIYMHREIHGLEELQKTTLRSLGLNGGRAMFRLIHRDPNQPKVQAHVTTLLAPKPSDNNEGTSRDKDNSNQRSVQSAGGKMKMIDPISLIKNEKQRLPQTDNEDSGTDKVQQSLKLKPEVETTTKNDDKHSEKVANKRQSSERDHDEDVEVEFLGDRNALVFSQGGATALPREELPDNFFDVTTEDARALLRDAIRLRAQLEEAPLLTSAQRELDQTKRMLHHLHKYRRTIIRIQFPDQMVLQGLFNPLEPVQSIKDFVKDYLFDPNVEFVLYTTPPKTILDTETRLIDANLVPSAIIYYSGHSALKPELKNKLTDPRVAGIQAVKSRIATRRDSEHSEMDITFESPLDHPSKTVEERLPQEPSAGPSNKSSNSVSPQPKWLKQPFK